MPRFAGVLSALGMLHSPPGRESTRAMLESLEEIDPARVENGFGDLGQALTRQLIDEGLGAEELSTRRSADLRYLGQSATLTVPWQGQQATAAAFHQAHRQRYGHLLDNPVELVCLRVRVSGPKPSLAAPPHCLLYTSPSPRDQRGSRMPSSA